MVKDENEHLLNETNVYFVLLSKIASLDIFSVKSINHKPDLKFQMLYLIRDIYHKKFKAIQSLQDFSTSNFEKFSQAPSKIIDDGARNLNCLEKNYATCCVRLTVCQDQTTLTQYIFFHKHYL